MSCLVDTDRARSLMDEFGVDILLASSRDNFGYLSGYWDHYGKYFETGWIGDSFITIAGICRERGDEPFMIVESVLGRDLEHKNPWIKDRMVYSSPEYTAHRGVKYEADPFKILADSLKSRGLEEATIGVELSHKSYTNELLPSIAVERIKKLLPKINLKDGSEILWKMRLLKTGEELRRIKESTRIISKAIEDSFNAIHEGLTERDFELIVRRNLIMQGVSIALINIHFGDDDLLRPTDRKLKRNEAIRLDLASIYEGYYGDVSRTYVLGEPSEKTVEVYNLVRRAMDQASKALSIGARCYDIYEAVYGSMKDTDYPLTIPIVGHGVGLCVHEAPYFMRNEMTIQPNMAFTVEIIRRTPKVGWIGIEDTFITDKDGCHNITELDHELHRY